MDELTEAQHVFEMLVESHPGESDYRRELARIHFYIGSVLWRSGKQAEATESFRKALAEQQRLADEHPEDDRFREDLAEGLYSMGTSLYQIGQPDRAIEAYGQSIAIRQELAADRPSVTRFREDLARTHMVLGVQLAMIDRTDEALRSLGRARPIQQKLADENPRATRFQSVLAHIHHNTGWVHLRAGRYPEALEAFAPCAGGPADAGGRSPERYRESVRPGTRLYEHRRERSRYPAGCPRPGRPSTGAWPFARSWRPPIPACRRRNMSWPRAT